MISLMMVTVFNGCAHQQTKVQYVYVPVPLERPDRPKFPTVSKTEMSCLSVDTVQTLKMRDDIMKTYMNRLEATIDATKVTSP